MSTFARGLAFLVICTASLPAPAAVPVSDDDLAKIVKPGMTPPEVKAALVAAPPQIVTTDWGLCQGGNRGLERYPLGDGRANLIVTYTADDLGNVRDSDKVVSASLARLTELRKEVGEELFDAFALVHAAPPPGERFDPVALVRAANALRPMGKAKIFKAMRLYEKFARGAPCDGRDARADGERNYRHAIDEQRIFCLLRVLFERKDGKPEMPEMIVGSPAPSLGEGEKQAPLYPIWLEGDLPFCLVYGYSLGGSAQAPGEHVDFCEKECVLRESALRPAASPIKLAERAFGSERWAKMTGESDAGVRYLLREQALTAVAALGGGAVDEGKMHPNCVDAAEATAYWRKFALRPTLREAKWDEKGQRFVGPD